MGTLNPFLGEKNKNILRYRRLEAVLFSPQCIYNHYKIFEENQPKRALLGKQVPCSPKYVFS